MRQLVVILAHIFMFFLLTILTQVGGIVYLTALWISKKYFKKLKFRFYLIFPILYLVITFLIVPLIAPIFGREKIENTNRIKASSFITSLLNRGYVKPQLNKALKEIDAKLSQTNPAIEIRYLDANFPFINGFPLAPHLSHNDGEKLDISFIYHNKNGDITNQKKSISGYGVFTPPQNGESNQIQKCFDKGYWQYDFPKYATLGSINSDLKFSNKGNQVLLKAFLKNKHIKKIFIEPHLQERLHIFHPKIRYHGCRAVRHDDHFHVQL